MQDGFAAIRDSGTSDLAKNMNRAPVLNHNGAVVGQSKAINRYLAKQLGFMGSSADEEGKSGGARGGRTEFLPTKNLYSGHCCVELHLRIR